MAPAQPRSIVDDALAKAIQALVAAPNVTDGNIFLESGAIFSRLASVMTLGGEERLHDAVTALNLAQRRTISRWFECLDQAGEAVKSTLDGADPKPSGTKGERALDRAFKQMLADAIAGEHHRERLLMFWRKLRKLMPPARTFAYFMAATHGGLGRIAPRDWSYAIFDRAVDADEQATMRAALPVMAYLRQIWDQRQATVTKVQLKPRRAAESSQT